MTGQNRIFKICGGHNAVKSWNGIGLLNSNTTLCFSPKILDQPLLKPLILKASES